MITRTILDRSNNQYPFTKSLFEDPHILYHGTWSAYAARIEKEGFTNAELPFPIEHLRTISNAGVSLGIGSYGRDLFFSNEGGGGRGGVQLSMVNSFWAAREYSTDGGGEVIRMMLKEAQEVERFGKDENTRLALQSRWEEGLKNNPHHKPTLRAVELLSTPSQFDTLCREVRRAREAIEAEVHGGFPVVYAIRVEQEWFGELWERHLYQMVGQRRTQELRC